MEILYKDDYEWSIFYFKNLDNTYTVLTKHGVKNGKMVEHTSIIKAGKNIGKKNETTIEEQAKLEALREWEKKKKMGYHLENETVDILKPMLALEYKKVVKFPAWVQPKLDGVRCLIYMKNGALIFQSRQNTLYEPMEHLIPSITAILTRLPNAILDGELYAHEMGFENVISMVRRAKVKHPDIHKIKYHLYDVFYKDTNMLFSDRHALLYGNYKKDTEVILVETTRISNITQIETLLKSYMDQSYEGIMIRGDGNYKHGRSKDLLKYKLFKDDEFEVVGHHEGANGIPVFDCKVKNTTFGVMMKGTLASRQERMKNISDYYGKMLTVKYQELSADGIPRFPVGIAFRDYE